MKKCLCVGLLLVSFLLIAACSGVVTNSDSSDGNQSAKKTILKMEKIQWAVDEQIVQGERGVYLEVTNNTDYSIASFAIQFAEREDLKVEERESFFSSLIASYTSTGWELDEDDVEYFEQIKKGQITIRAETERVIKPGESITKIPCCYYTGYYIVDKLPQFEVTEPDIATICYIKDGLIYTIYYDFHSGKYSEEEKTEAAYYWTEGELGERVPKPDAEVVKKSYCDEIRSFNFEVYGISEADYKSYINQCEELGYTNDLYVSDTYFRANDSDGYRIRISYYEDEWEMDVYLDAP